MRHGNVYFDRNHDPDFIPANPPAVVRRGLDYREGDKTLREPSNRAEPTFEFNESAKRFAVNYYHAAIDWAELIRRVAEIRKTYRGELTVILLLAQDTVIDQLASLLHHGFDRNGNHGIQLVFERTLKALGEKHE